ncbi:hypothetical protein Patl1_18308 [Pistacia atlantica]|uniref:Uncharacterized protein n=1 Tax=Pistacia atlantica TaxID=434234 RepID=A0ACC1BYI2_9ROSI|nr:hypothetical protein Patl1_18308 [Pistacia atlantica]
MTPNQLHIRRSDFTNDFIFGASTAAAQIEGSAKYGGKGTNIWDYYLQKYTEKINDGSNLDIAIDSYRRYKEDVKALKDLGIDSHKFSLSWARILPS